MLRGGWSSRIDHVKAFYVGKRKRRVFSTCVEPVAAPGRWCDALEERKGKKGGTRRGRPLPACRLRCSIDFALGASTRWQAFVISHCFCRRCYCCVPLPPKNLSVCPEPSEGSKYAWAGVVYIFYWGKQPRSPGGGTKCLLVKKTRKRGMRGTAVWNLAFFVCSLLVLRIVKGLFFFFCLVRRRFIKSVQIFWWVCRFVSVWSVPSVFSRLSAPPPPAHLSNSVLSLGAKRAVGSSRRSNIGVGAHLFKYSGLPGSTYD